MSNFEKLKNDAEDLSNEWIPLLDKNKKCKKAMLYLLYNDIIPIDSKLNNSTDIFLNPEDKLEKDFDEMVSRISNFDNYNIIFAELKKRMSSKKNEMSNKIKECNEHLKILEKSYINLQLEKVINSNDEFKMNFMNKSVLTTNSDDINILLGEFFARFMFIKTKESYNIFSFDEELFYSDSKLSSYIDNSSIKEFKDIDDNFKYWIVLIFLIGNMFKNNSHYSTIFNKKDFKIFIDKLSQIIPVKKKEEKKTPEQK